MTPIEASTLPGDSLLTGFARADDYTDCFTCEVARQVSLSDFIAAFYNSPAFRPERWVLHLIGKGSGGADIARLAAGQTDSFAAWSVIRRTDNEILLQDFQHRTCSWLAVTALAPDRTRLSFGSGVRNPGSLAFRLLVPVHRAYARALLASAVRALR